MGRFGGSESRLDRAGRRSAPGPVPSLGFALADGQEFTKHDGAVAPGTDLRTGLIGPIDGNLGDTVAALPGDIEQLEVERVPVDASDRKQILGHAPAEQFEPALGVGDVSNAQTLHQGVEDGAQYAPVPARPDGIVGMPRGEGP